MKVILFGKEEIKSTKTGEEYVKCSAITERGTGIEIFTSKENFDSFRLPATKILNKDDVAEIFAKYQTADVEFNNRGRLENLS